MHCSREFSLGSTILSSHLNAQNHFNVEESKCWRQHLWWTGVKGNVYAVDVLFLRKTGVNCSLASKKKKKKVPYCFSAVDSCCYATNRMSLSTGYIKLVFPAHISARSFYTLAGGYGSGFLQDWSMKYVFELLFWGLLQLR